MWQPRLGGAWDVQGDGKSVLRAQRGHLLGAPEHAQPGRLGHDQRPAAAVDLPQHRSSPSVRRRRRRCGPASLDAGAAARRRRSPTSRGVRVFDRDYANPRIYSCERRLRAGVHARTGRATSTSSGRRASNLTRFLNYNRAGPALLRSGAGHRQRLRLSGAHPCGPAARRGDGDDEPRQVALPRPDARRPQALLARLSARSELRARRRTRTTTRTSAIRSPIAASTSSICDLDYGPSDRDIRHKFNFFGYFELPYGI